MSCSLYCVILIITSILDEQGALQITQRPTFVTSLLSTSSIVASGDMTKRKNQLLASWKDAQRCVQSLVVEFTLESKDKVFEERHSSEGTLRLIRTSKNEFLASYEVVTKRPSGEFQERHSALLNSGSIYLLNHDKKIAIRFKLAKSDLLWFLGRYFNPFMLLLDLERAEEKYKLEVAKQDEWYTYLSVKPKQVKRDDWLPVGFHEGRVVLMNKVSEGVPKDMPRQLWYVAGVSEYTFEIKVWRLNAAGAPSPEDFAKPEDRPGWKIVQFPF